MSTASGWPEHIEQLIAAAGHTPSQPAPTRASQWLPPGAAPAACPPPAGRRRVGLLLLPVKVLAWAVVGIAGFYGFVALLMLTGGFAVAPLLFVFLAIRQARRRKRLRDAEHAAAVKGVRKLHSRIKRANRRP